MRRFLSLSILLALLTISTISKPLIEPNNRVASLSELNEEASKRVKAKAYIELIPETSDVFKEADLLETGYVPNYLRAFGAIKPKAIKPLSELVKTALYTGAISPELKMAMGLRIAQINNSPYVAAHMQRLLRGINRGTKFLEHAKSNNHQSLTSADAIALKYAESLTRNVNGVNDSDFQEIRQQYNDSQLVELTMVVAFFNHFTRFCEALNLPVEQWALETGNIKAPQAKYEPPIARVALISDIEMDATNAAVTASKDPARQASGLGLGIANSQRAMLRAPQFARAWREYGSTIRADQSLDRNLMLHVSFAVSMVNGCHYCTLHQVLGLRRLGINPAKLIAMKKDDSALSPRELTAVTFARKLTLNPASITTSDYENLKNEFSDKGALEVLLQTCHFNFMNRFTDGLRLPSEDEAIRVYKEVYGSDK
jgi:AhpD family alkylhydroperoxidase